MRLTALKILPIAPVDGSLQTQKTLRFSWSLPETDRLLTIKICLSKRQDFAKSGRLEWTTDNRRQALTVPNTLDKGKWYWKIELYRYKTRLSVSAMRSFRVKKLMTAKNPTKSGARRSPAQRKAGDGTHIGSVHAKGVKAAPGNEEAAKITGTKTAHTDNIPLNAAPKNIEELNAASANLTPSKNLDFFPIGIYGAASADFKELWRIGFNAVQLSGSSFDETLALVQSADKNHLKALISPPPKDYDHNAAGENTASSRSLLASDAVLAWYLADEPEGRSLSPKIVRDRLDSLRRAGFMQPGAIALERAWRAADYAPAVNIFMSDAYPVPFNPLSWLSECLDTISTTAAGDPTKRAWAVIQAFGWQYSSAQARATGLARMPTAAELKALTYLALIHRAHGIFFYTYRSGRYSLKDHKKLWSGVKDTVKELQMLHPVLSLPGEGEAVALECSKKDAWGYAAVHALLKKTRGKESGGSSFMLIAVNTLNEPAAAKITLGGDGYRNGSGHSSHNIPIQNRILSKGEDPGNEQGRRAIHGSAAEKRMIESAADLFTGRLLSHGSSSINLHFAPLERKVILISTNF